VIAGSLLQWLHQFFERPHKIRVGYALSSSVQLVSGVVQGSGIGPMMFLIFINELAEVQDRAGVKVRLFADDVKVYVQIVGNYDVDKLKRALDLLVDWAQTWHLTVSVDKCCVLNIGRSSLLEHNVSIAGHKLPTLLLCRDLGVTISHDRNLLNT